MLTPSFQLHLRESLATGLVCFGKFDGETLSLAAVVNGNRVLIHNPNASSADNSCFSSLRIGQAIVAIAAGCLDPTHGRDILFIGTSQAVQGYDLHHNADVFCHDVPEGVGCLMVGKCNKNLVPLLYVGSSLSIIGLDNAGKEQMWNVTNDDVVVLASADADDDGTHELLAGTKSADILAFKEEGLIAELKEADRIMALCHAGHGLFAYTLSNCTVGVYSSLQRSWRVKSKHTVNSVCWHSDASNGQGYLISGWNNGKFETRIPATGDVLFREQLATSIVHVASVDFRGEGRPHIVVCTTDGVVRGYSSVDKLSKVLQAKHDEAHLDQVLQSLEQKKRETAQELQLVNQNLRDEAAGAAGVAVSDVIPAETDVSGVLEPNRKALCLDLRLKTNNRCVIKGAIVFAEHLFPGESTFVHPEQAETTLSIPLKPKKDCAIEMLIKVMVGSATSEVFHIFELKSIIAPFAMFVPQLQPCMTQPGGFVTFQIAEAPRRVQLWLQDQLSCSMPLDQDGSGSAEFLCLRGGCPLGVSVEANGTGSSVTIMSDSVQVAGDITHALAGHLGTTELSAISEFPDQIALARTVLAEAAEGSMLASRMQTDVADVTVSIKSLLVKAEDARLLRNSGGLKRHFRALWDLNQGLVDEHRKRVTKHAEVAGQLRAINALIQSAARLRFGRAQEALVAQCRLAVQSQDAEALIQAIREGG
eukprot:jgi/Ulvmu1/7619/UM038_0044.1